MGNTAGIQGTLKGDQVQITLSARLRKEQYMAFGISGAEGRPAMLGADVVVAYWDTRVNQPRVSDYSISHLAQCDGERGVCPDQRIGGTNDAQLVSGNQKNGITTITYRRPLAAKETMKDKEILTSRSQSVIAAFGPLNSRYEANAHSFMDTTRNDVQLDFGAQNENTCIGLAETDSSGPAPWPARVVAGAHNLTARIGPAGGARGYTPITDNDIISGNQKNGITTITYRRPLAAKETMKDKEILTSRSQSVIAAFGPLNSRYEANAHSFMDTTRNDVQLDFGAQNENTCIGLAETDSSGPAPWPARVVAGAHNLTARIGPAGGARGYTPITGHPSWGIAWYINDQLIPEIYVERGKTYTFMVEGGDDRTNPAKFHPFYISDSSEGGFGQKKEEDQRKQRVFAGVAYDNEGYPYPTAVGRYCEWTHKTIDQSATSETFEDYMNTLQLECNEGEPAVLNWTVAHETPDLLYYQCYTHNNLGWKIHVVDPGTPVPLAGDKQRVNAAGAPALSALAPLALAAARHLANRGR
ncbi:hypothetical protein B5X24_HaOG202475 [Helicoverpa armigera]|uniref:DOMON domain-containing protein n=1 Tax=Helicoverpa armigera TaxID=29058 RepID=A0A2W1BX69_HELAM|nr:hypothetical protein B5X24_HaOG202475 [Helicoverpa armigera]